jgi:hypothetical protein
MNYCHNCGNEKIANTKFCSFCGQPYAENTASQPQFQPATPAIPAFSPQFQTRVQPAPAEITVSGGGNIPAKTGLVFFLCAAVLTFILSFLTFWTFVQTGRELGEFFISGTRWFNSMGGTILCLIAVFLAVLAVSFSSWGIVRRYRKPERFGYLKTALTFFILSLGLLIIQLASVGYGMAQWYSFYYQKTPAYKPANNTGATVQAKVLFAAYQSSKADADSKYKGRNIKVFPPASRLPARPRSSRHR